MPVDLAVNAKYMLYSEHPTVLLKHLNTMLLTNFENLHSISNIFQETHNFLVLTSPVIICIYLRTSDRHFLDQGNVRHPTSKLLTYDLVQTSNTIRNPSLRIFAAGKASLVWFWIEYFYQRWKRLYISWMIVGNYTLYTKSDLYEFVNVITNFLGQPRSFKFDFLNGLNNERCRLFQSNCHKRNNFFVQISSLVYFYIVSWLMCRFLQIHFIYHQNTVTRKGAFFIKCF